MREEITFRVWRGSGFIINQESYRKMGLKQLFREQKKTIRLFAGAFFLLILVNAFKQIMERQFPNSPTTPSIVLLVHTTLLAIWWSSIFHRVTILHIRKFILLENLTMIFWVFMKFLQDMVFYRDIEVLRFSGYFISIPMVLVPLLGFYSTLGLGKEQEYRMEKKMYYLLIPAFLLILLMLTNEWHGLVFYTDPSEPQPNLYFHPNFFLYVLAGFSVVFTVAQLVVIFRRSRNSRYNRVIRGLPFVIVAILVITMIPYMLSSFNIEWELIEFGPAMFFLEIFLWESCIACGLVPVNSRYDEVFDRSTVAMKIISSDGELIRSSAAAEPGLDMNRFLLIKKEGTITKNGKEYHIAPLSEGYVAWKNDISELEEEMHRLSEIKEELQSDSELLGNEVSTRNREERVRARSEVYNRLSLEVSQQLDELKKIMDRINEIISKWDEHFSGYRDDEPFSAEDDELFTKERTKIKWLFLKISALGTYIKRRCNLRLIQLSGENVSVYELALALNDLVNALSVAGVEAESPLIQQGDIDNIPDSEEAIRFFDEFFHRYEEEVAGI